MLNISKYVELIVVTLPSAAVERTARGARCHSHKTIKHECLPTCWHNVAIFGPRGLHVCPLGLHPAPLATILSLLASILPLFASISGSILLLLASILASPTAECRLFTGPCEWCDSVSSILHFEIHAVSLIVGSAVTSAI